MRPVSCFASKLRTRLSLPRPGSPYTLPVAAISAVLFIVLLAIASACTSQRQASEPAEAGDASSAEMFESETKDDEAETLVIVGQKTRPARELQQLRALGYLGDAALPRSAAPGVAQRMVGAGFRDGWRNNGNFNTEQYDSVEEDGFLSPQRTPLSTFSIDVDTASYSNVRRFLRDGSLPPAGAVRIEELVNYFSYEYPRANGDEPFSITTELATAPWNADHQLLMVGLQGRVIEERDLPPRNLVFLLDVSGSMAASNKLGLVKRGLRDLTNQLRPEDHVAIVVYAGADRVVLPPTSGSDSQRIAEALANLEAGGSTNGAGGIQRAYQLAREHFEKGAINRVILATDGDFNIGITNRSDFVELIEKEREAGVFLTVLGVGTGNIQDATMEELADKGNGNYAYLDSIAEARKVLIQEAGGTLVTIAKDVKLQLEFNPQRVSAYRLIGYENRRLADRDFNDDTKDAGEIGAGHSVTALYEIVPVGVEAATGAIDPLRYQQDPSDERAAAGSGGELALVKIRYKAPEGATSRKLEQTVAAQSVSLRDASEELRFSSAVALFGMLLRESDVEFRRDGSYAMVRELARDALGTDAHGHRAEFLSLVARASDLQERTPRAEEIGSNSLTSESEAPRG